MPKIVDIEVLPLGTVRYINVAPGEREIVQSALAVHRAWTTGLPPALDAVVLTADLQSYEREEPLVGGRVVTPIMDTLSGIQSLPPSAKPRRLLGFAVAEALADWAESGLLPPASRTGVVLAGDFFADPTLRTRGGVGDVQEVWRAFASRFRWVVGVAGNHDSFDGKCDFGETFRQDSNIHALDGHSLDLDGLRIGGVSGVLGKPGKPWRREWREFQRRLTGVLATSPDLLVLHQGPDDPLVPSRRGEPLVRDALLAVLSNMLVVNGHKHWDEPLATFPPAMQVLNVDSRCLVLMRRP